MKNKPYFPMFIDLSDKNIVVVGGGNIATRRVKTLLSFTRNIRVIAPKVTMEMMELGKAGYVELITRPVKRTDFAMAYMVIAATNDRKLNDEIHRICRQDRISAVGRYNRNNGKSTDSILYETSGSHRSSCTSAPIHMYYIQSSGQSHACSGTR